METVESNPQDSVSVCHSQRPYCMCVWKRKIGQECIMLNNNIIVHVQD